MNWYRDAITAVREPCIRRTARSCDYVWGTMSKPCGERLWAFEVMSKYILSYRLAALWTKCPHRAGLVGSGTFWQFADSDANPRISRWIRVFSGAPSSVQTKGVISRDSNLTGRPIPLLSSNYIWKISEEPRMFGICRKLDMWWKSVMMYYSYLGKQVTCWSLNLSVNVCSIVTL